MARPIQVPIPPTLSSIKNTNIVSDPRPITYPYPPVATRVSHTLSTKDKHDMIQKAKQMFKGRLQREDVIKSYYVSNRVSPGGPDPRHH